VVASSSAALGLDLPLDVRGTPSTEVWRALREIPAGSTAATRKSPAHRRAQSRARVARRVHRTRCGRHSCHRWCATTALSGYRWGVERKRALLEREANHNAPSAARALPRCRRGAGRALDWETIADLDAQGSPRRDTFSGGMRSACDALCVGDRFRSGRDGAHGFGRASTIFAYPLPETVRLCARAVPGAALIANRWNEIMKIGSLSGRSSAFLRRCHCPPDEPTPLSCNTHGRLQLPAPGPLRQHVFPLQATFLLSAREGFAAAIRAHGTALACNRARCTPWTRRRRDLRRASSAGAGARGSYRVKLRHGVTECAS